MLQLWEHLENPSKILPKPKGVRGKIEAESKTLMLLPNIHIPKLKTENQIVILRHFQPWLRGALKFSSA